jgi:hypothetical protein
MIVVVAASAYLMFAETSSGSSCSRAAGEAEQCTSYSRTLVEDQGEAILLLLAIPVALSGAVFWLLAANGDRSLAVGLAGLFLALCVISIFSIGILYVPGALLLLTAGLLYTRKTEISSV